MAKEVNLTSKELASILANKKMIGAGTEGACFAVNNEIYKIYHNTNGETVTKAHATYDDDGVRVFDINEIRKNKINDPSVAIKYTDKYGTKLSMEDGLNRAIEKGNKVVKTKLPTKVLYVDGKVKGCVYPYFKHTQSIYAAYKKTYKTRLQICKKLIERVKELIANNIYPVDLCQKGEKSLYDKSIVNVLLDWRNNPIIIDLEGKSTIYTEAYDERLEEIAVGTLATLVLEILSREDIQEDLVDENYYEVERYLKELGLTYEQYESFIDNTLKMDDLEAILSNIEETRENKGRGL